MITAKEARMTLLDKKENAWLEFEQLFNKEVQNSCEKGQNEVMMAFGKYFPYREFILDKIAKAGFVNKIEDTQRDGCVLYVKW